MRCCLMRCLNGKGRVDWQLNHVRATQGQLSFAKKQLFAKYYQILVMT